MVFYEQEICTIHIEHNITHLDNVNVEWNYKENIVFTFILLFFI